jgi:hypothetical protein
MNFKKSANIWAGFISDSEWGPVPGSFEHGNESPNSINGGEFLEYLNNYQLLKGYAFWS